MSFSSFKILLNSLGSTTFKLIKLYTSLQNELVKLQIVELPATIEEYLQAIGLDKGNMKYNPLNNKLEIDSSKGKVGFMESLDNLAEYSRYLMGHKINPAQNNTNDYHNLIAQVTELYPTYKVKTDEEGIKLCDFDGNEKFLVSTSELQSGERVIVLEDISNRVREEGVTNARS